MAILLQYRLSFTMCNNASGFIKYYHSEKGTLINWASKGNIGNSVSNSFYIEYYSFMQELTNKEIACNLSQGFLSRPRPINFKWGDEKM